VSSVFISDLHLTEERPEANERFISFLEDKARGAGALYILGDFFEYWIGDDDLEEPFNAVIAGLLRDLSQRGRAAPDAREPRLSHRRALLRCNGG
jgi:UDP-2,3-diacylglucosamine hydrolase